jgi:hypothetical protein
MTTWILIIFAYAGTMASGDSISLATPIFATEVACASAGEAAKKMTEGTTKVIKYRCVPTGIKEKNT